MIEETKILYEDEELEIGCDDTFYFIRIDKQWYPLGTKNIVNKLIELDRFTLAKKLDDEFKDIKKILEKANLSSDSLGFALCKAKLAEGNGFYKKNNL